MYLKLLLKHSASDTNTYFLSHIIGIKNNISSMF